MLVLQIFKTAFCGTFLLLVFTEIMVTDTLLVSSNKIVRQNSAILTFIPAAESNASKLTDQQAVKLKEIRKFARLAGHDSPENITEVKSDICYKDDCLKAAKEFFLSLDLSQDPCDSWEKYACEWRTLSTKTALDQLTALTLKVEKQVNEILLDTNTEKMALQMAQSYHKSCLKWFQDFKQSAHIVNYLKKFGNWPLLSGVREEGQWSDVLSEILRIAPENVSPFLLKIQPIELDEKKVALQIDSGSTNVWSDFDGIKELLQILRKKPPPSIEIEAEDLLEMQKSLRILSSVSFDSVSSNTSKTIKLNDLQTELTKDVPDSKVNVMRLLQSTFEGTDFKIGAETEAFVDYASLVKYLKTLQSLKSTSVFNILLLQLTLILVGEVTSLLEENEFALLENYKKAWSSHRCLEETTDVFQYALSKEYIGRHPVNSKSREKVKEMASMLQNGFFDVISSIKWLQGAGLEFTREKIQSAEVLVAIPEWMEKENVELESYYDLLVWNKDITGTEAYLNRRVAALSWLNGKYWKMKFDGTNVNGWNFKSSNGFVASANPEYIPSFNELRIPAGLMQPPLFSEDFPGYMNFGGLGSIIAKELARIFDTKGVYLNKAGEVGNWLDEKTYKSYEDWLSKIESVWKDGRNLNLNDKVINVLSYQITAKGYEKYLQALKKENKEEIKLPGVLTLSSEKLFHLKFTNVLCESAVMKRLKFYNDKGQKVHNSDGIYPLEKSSRFATIFGCELENVETAIDLI